MCTIGRRNINYYNEIKKELINNEINKAVKNYSINRSDLNSYYNVGKILSEAGKHYGEGIIKEYSKKLKYDLNKNYSVRLLYRMLKYYNFASEENLPTLSAKLSWSHYDEILRFDDINEITFYIRISEQQNLSVRQLREKIKSNEYERLPEATKSKLINQQESNVVDFVKNPIKIKNSNKYDIFSEKVFEDIKHIDENKNEYWLARELMPLLEYAEWRKFKGVINKGIINCKNSNYNALDHFVGADKMVSIVSQTTRNIQDYKLTRYACYLIVLNCDPGKKIIALAKTYFAI